MIDFETTETAELLRRSAADGPDPDRVARRAIAVAHDDELRPARSRRAVSIPLALPAAALLALVGAWAVLYFVPVSETAALAAAPSGIQNGWLDHLGLNSTDLTVSGATATSAGVTVRVDGLYADATRTVVVLHSSGGLLDPSSVTIDDQFFHHYTVLDAVSNSQTGLQTMTFAPFASPTGATGARVHFEATRELGAQAVGGRWAVDAVVVPRTGNSLSASGGTVGSWNAAFTSIVRSGASVSMTIRLDGPPVSGEASAPAGTKPQPNVSVELDGPAGAVQPADLGVNPGSGTTYVSALWVGIPPGSYQIALTVSGATFETPLQVGD